jgi:hypothetical protein
MRAGYVGGAAGLALVAIVANLAAQGKLLEAGVTGLGGLLVALIVAGIWALFDRRKAK